MKIQNYFQGLHDAVKKMGAEGRDFVLEIELPELDPIDTQLEVGIDVKIDDIKKLSNGLLSYKGRQILLYIQDHGWRVSEALENGSKGKKFHVAYCGTLESMHQNGRYDRYVAKHDISGEFFIDGYSNTKENISGETKLDICRRCLLHLNYEGYEDHASRGTIFNGFSLQVFFEKYKQFFKHKPKYQSGQKNSNYTKEWTDIGRRKKESVSWICEQCNVDLNGHRSLLHCHHINGVKHDESTRNLKALCVECHAKQPSHGHMRLVNADKIKLKNLRKIQVNEVRKTITA